MRKPNLVPLLACVFVPTVAAADPPDLCADVYLDATGSPITDVDGTELARFCKQTGPDAPVWGHDLCCSISATAATCKPTAANGRCTAGLKMWCEYGELIGSHVTCYQPLPDACEAGYCVAAPQGPVSTVEPMCCWGGNCYPIELGENCPGHFVSCNTPFTNTDGTVGCADDD